MDNASLNQLLQTVSQKLGTSPDALRQALESGKLDAATKSMRPQDAQKLQSILGNQAQMQKLMQTPQAKALYEKLTGSKPQ